MNVRRMAAVTMSGGRDRTSRRVAAVLAFAVGFVGPIIAGVGLGSSAGPWPADWPRWVAAGFFVGIGLNYAPLTLHALTLTPAGALARELDGVDVPAELRYYGAKQAWAFVPLAILVQSLLPSRRSAS